MLRLNVEKLRQEIANYEGLRTAGRLRSATGLLSCTLPAAVGEQCEIMLAGGEGVRAEVIGFDQGIAHLVAYEQRENLQQGLRVVSRGRQLDVPVGNRLLGRVLDGLGRPIDGLGPLDDCPRAPVRYDAPPAFERARILEPFVTGQRAIDGMLTLGRGQRVGIFAGSGVGKSTLLGEIAKGSSSEVNVIALVGERGRELRPFIEDCLGTEGMERSVVVVATCEQPPIMRVRAVQTAITIADDFRSGGSHVLFMLDSITRLAMSQRELGLALGEPPTSRGYTPSVFQLLATVIERLGNDLNGSITGIITILVDGDDLDEPISDAARGLLDGHIVLDRRMAERGHFPAISVSQSISRVSRDVTTPEHQAAVRKVRAILATHAEMEDLIRIGAYSKGASPAVDRAVDLLPAITAFLKQDPDERTAFTDTSRTLERIAAAWPY
jgi:flagellum-specific ATP synthase